MCEEDPSAFCNMICKLVPKEFQQSEQTGNGFYEVWKYIGAQQDKADAEGEGEKD
jgi:hypothetical protein